MVLDDKNIGNYSCKAKIFFKILVTSSNPALTNTCNR